MELYMQMVKALREEHGIYEAKRIAKERAITALIEDLEDKLLSVEQKQDVIVSVLKLMRL